MFETVAFTYAMLASFVLTSAKRNNQQARTNPPMVRYVGYTLCGSLGALSTALFACAALGIDPLRIG